jgi:tRNA (guanine37-N1)-methyltransferase
LLELRRDTLAVVRVVVVTLFPGYFGDAFKVGIVGRALSEGRLEVETVDLREHGLGPYRQVDDAPFGGGPGMVLMIEPIAAALAPFSESRRVLLTPAGKRLDQSTLDEWSQLNELVLVCGRYEGVDERVAMHLVDEEVSLGDFVLAGGEAGALLIIEGVTRLLAGAVGNPESLASESFRGGIEEPQYTRPADFRGWKVPEVLLSGDHRRIEAWREEQRRSRTTERRPDLID